MFCNWREKAGFGKLKKKEEKALSPELYKVYLKAQALMIGLSIRDFLFIPIGELSDLIDAKSILLGLADEGLADEQEEYFSLR